MLTTNIKRSVLNKARFEKIIVVTKMTQLDALLARFNTAAQARFYLEQAGEDFDPIEHEHQQYYKVVDQVRSLVPRGVKTLVLERDLLPQYQFEANDLIIAIGPDGLVVNTAKYLYNQPILAINPEPQSIDGVLLPFNIFNTKRGLENAMYGDIKVKNIAMAEAQLTDGQQLLAFNDLFIGANSHVSARYEIRMGQQQEFHSSSGVIISTGAGSTGWLQSIYAGASGIVQALGGQVVPPPNHGRMDWSSNYLVFAVREPFPSKRSKTNMVYGVITPENPLHLNSHMMGNGVIFSDGVESDYIGFNTGTSAIVRVADKKTKLIIK